MSPPRIFKKLAKHFGYELVPLKRIDYNTRDESAYLDLYRDKNINRKDFNKIFCVGSNKTGTTTIERIFQKYDFRVPNQQQQEQEITHVIATGDFLKFKNFVEQYDAFQDMPFSSGWTFIACDALFPDSKFILTIRDSEKWYKSMIAYHQRIIGLPDSPIVAENFFKDKSLYLHLNYSYEQMRRNVLIVKDFEAVPDWRLAYDKENTIRNYELRNESIIKYFYNRPNDLLIIDVTKELDTSRICDFLGLGADHVISMPHENRNS